MSVNITRTGTPVTIERTAAVPGLIGPIDSPTEDWRSFAGQHSDPAVLNAMTSLKTYTTSAMKTIAASFTINPGDQSSAVALPGSSLGALEPKSFVAYSLAMNRVVNRAYDLLKSTESAEELLKALRQRRDEIQETYYHSVPHVRPGGPKLSAFNSYDEALKFADRQLLSVLEGIASGSAREELEIRAYDLAIMSLTAAHENERVENEWNSNAAAVTAHTEMMAEAFRATADDSWQATYPYAQSRLEAAFLTFCDMKLERQGYIPHVHLIHDLDSNLLPVQDSALKPGNIIGRLAELLDKIEPIPAHQRLVLADNLARLPHMHILAEEMFRHAGRATHTPFSDAIEAINTAQKHGLRNTIVTANMALYAQGAAEHLAEPAQIEIVGKKPDAYHSSLKPHRIAEMFLKDPNGVYICSDDRDSGLVDAIERGTIFPAHPTAARLEHITFFASRVRAADESFDHRLAQTLRENGIPFAENRATGAGNARTEGYQGVHGLVKAYLQWRTLRQAEGWPATEIGAKAQAVTRGIVANAAQEAQRIAEALAARSHDIRSELARANGEPLDHFPIRELARIENKRGLLTNGGNGLDIPSIRALSLTYAQSTANIPEESPRRNVIATTLFREQQRLWTSHARLAQNGHIMEGELRRMKLGGEHVGIIAAENVSIDRIESILERRDAKYAFGTAEVDFLVVRLTANSAAGAGREIEQTVIFGRTAEAQRKLRGMQGVDIICDDRAVVIHRESSARSHEQQFQRFTRFMNSHVTVAEVYYRNGFAPAGGLEKTMREQAKVLLDMGFKVRNVGGNAPDAKSYDDKLLAQMDHRTIPGLHERDELVQKIAASLYRKEIHPEYYAHYRALKERLRQELSGVDVILLHNPLFLRNVPMTQAIIDLWRDNELPHVKNLVGWVHDVARFTEPDYFPEKIEVGSPWWYVNTRFEGITYIPVSDAVGKKLATVPCNNEPDCVPLNAFPPIMPGSDYEAMARKNRVTELLQPCLDWNEIDQLWVTPGRVAERKNTLAAIAAISLLDRACLIITGSPKVERQRNPRTGDVVEVVNDPYFDLLRAFVRENGIENKVIFLCDIPGVGTLSDTEYEDVLAALVQTADGVVTLPKEEGFGIDPRNAALLSQATVVSDDPALIQNLGPSARFVPRNGHALEAALELAAVNRDMPNTALRRAARTTATWGSELKKGASLFGTEDLGIENPGIR